MPAIKGVCISFLVHMCNHTHCPLSNHEVVPQVQNYPSVTGSESAPVVCTRGVSNRCCGTMCVKLVLWYQGGGGGVQTGAMISGVSNWHCGATFSQ